MRRFLRRLLLFPLALLFLFEAWLWDITGGAIKALLGWIPYERIKLFVARRVENYSPWLTLTVFIIPLLILLPLKFITLWLVAHKYWWGAIFMGITAKLLGLGVSSFLFAVCKPKLMELRFVAWLYRHCIRLRERARDLVKPYTKAIREAMRSIRDLLPRSNRLEQLRRRVHRWRRNRA